MEHIKELLSTGTGTEGQLLIPRKIFDTLVQDQEKALIPRSEAGWMFPPSMIPGSSIEFNTEDENKMDVREIAEGGEVFLDEDSYTNTNIKPRKYGVAIRITRELMEDSMFPLLQRNIQKAGRRMAENENSLVITELDTAANTVTGGSAITIANITRAMQHIDDNDYEPTSFLIGMEVLNDLRNIDTFVEANKLGSTEMIQRGFVGTIYGMNVMKTSTNAGMTTTSSYVYDRDNAYAIAEKRTLMVENFDLPTFDMSGAVVTQRIAVKAIRTNAMAKITTT